MRRPAATPPPDRGGGGACAPRAAAMATLPPAAERSPVRELTPGWLREPRIDAGGGAPAVRTVPRSARAIKPLLSARVAAC